MSLLARIEDHLNQVTQKLETLEKTGTPLPPGEVQRDLAIGIELNQQYVDLLDEVIEEIQENSDYGDDYFEIFSKNFDEWFSTLTPAQVEQYTRKG